MDRYHIRSVRLRRVKLTLLSRRLSRRLRGNALQRLALLSTGRPNHEKSSELACLDRLSHECALRHDATSLGNSVNGFARRVGETSQIPMVLFFPEAPGMITVLIQPVGPRTGSPTRPVQGSPGPSNTRKCGETRAPADPLYD